MEVKQQQIKQIQKEIKDNQQQLLDRVQNLINSSIKFGLYKDEISDEQIWENFTQIFQQEILEYDYKVYSQLQNQKEKEKKLIFQFHFDDQILESVLNCNSQTENIRDILVKYQRYQVMQEYTRFLKAQEQLDQVLKFELKLQKIPEIMKQNIVKTFLRQQQVDEIKAEEKFYNLVEEKKLQKIQLENEILNLKKVLDADQNHQQYLKLRENLENQLNLFQKAKQQLDPKNIGKSHEKNTQLYILPYILEKFGLNEDKIEVFQNIKWLDFQQKNEIPIKNTNNIQIHLDAKNLNIQENDQKQEKLLQYYQQLDFSQVDENEEICMNQNQNQTIGEIDMVIFQNGKVKLIIECKSNVFDCQAGFLQSGNIRNEKKKYINIGKKIIQVGFEVPVCVVLSIEKKILDYKAEDIDIQYCQKYQENLNGIYSENQISFMESRCKEEINKAVNGLTKDEIDFQKIKKDLKTKFQDFQSPQTYFNENKDKNIFILYRDL
ncbi:hypothetical protein PPERSA_01707 [Pseudocohnilembus persalinus]|uniref:Uncharacterized protein n=1 Tax=Pseudocohnilembus persalinus TaxID=266149 RepID=A0A0V0R0T5_PSEPJ|nr:hypothetical protein PPERSA_01707 [Pseudocohnilembus persalinus]|eukprot:KRX08162.1 hypothetical protein PPERSA_01707 [Pseudocohnilembus persalinus]